MGQKNFIILFDEKEGTTAAVQMLDNIPGVSLIHCSGKGGWEPFDRHECGLISHTMLVRLFDMIYSDEKTDMDILNGLYLKKGKHALVPFEKDRALGFKMRFTSPNNRNPWLVELPGINQLLKDRYEERRYHGYCSAMYDCFKRNNVAVFFSLRQNIFLWALSKYHGDGSGQKGHLQFNLTYGKIRREEIPKIHIDSDRFERTIFECRRIIRRKKKQAAELKKLGLSVYPIIYEEFCDEKEKFIKGFAENLDFRISDDEIQNGIAKGVVLQKVHSGSLSEYVHNHEEIEKKFSHYFIKWDDPIEDLPSEFEKYSKT